jgi:thymidine kinase
LVPFCEEAANNGKIVIVAALDGTFKRQKFGSVLDLIPLAEKVTKLNAVCMRCQSDAAFTQKLSTSKKTVEIGGSDKYIAVCRKCFFTEPGSPHKPKRCKSDLKQLILYSEYEYVRKTRIVERSKKIGI